jgi:transcriptional regulator with GAF, ATPase, and Fis domain
VRDLQASLSLRCSAERASREAITAMLARCGVTALDADPAPAIAALVFVDAGDAVIELVQRAGEAGASPILVIDVGDDALPGALCWQLLAAGASDVLRGAPDATTGARIAARIERTRAVDQLMSLPIVRDNLVGQSRAWLAMLRQLVEVARFTSTSILLLGESGTGKELAARLVHTLDPRPDKPADVVVLDCGTVVPELSGSEFFGHERGAFSSAFAARDGAFALADGGTLFLDEVGELPAALQTQLLRAVQERTYKRVGGNAWYPTRFRLVTATNRDLVSDVAGGRFRCDLYHRLASWVCRIPPLRERPDDIVRLARHFAAEFRPELDGELGETLRAYLLARPYAGNVRELRQLMFRICCRHVGPGPLSIGDVPEDERQGDHTAAWHAGGFEHAIRCALAGGTGLKEIGRRAEDIAYRIAVEEAEGNLQQAARTLRVTDRALQMRRAQGGR